MAVQATCDRVTSAELAAWCELMRLDLLPIEARIILNLDSIRRSNANRSD